MTRYREVVTLLAVVFALSDIAAAQSVLTDDAHVSTAGESKANFGHHHDLVVSPTSSVYLKFDLVSGLPASTAGSTVEKATLLLYVSGVTSAGSLQVHVLADAWDEGTLTAGNAPPPAMLVGTTDSIEGHNRDRFLALDLTSLVQQWLGDDGLGANGLLNHGIVLTSHGGTRVTFDSKENPQTGHEAQLQIQRRSSGGTVTSVDAESPLSVTNAATTPTISLGIVPAAHGGTGLISAGPAGNFLRSVGGVWSSEPLTASDVPDLGESYIRNGSAPQAAANFNVGGTGAADVFDAVTQFNLGGTRILSRAGVGNLFAGEGAGSVNSSFGGAFFGFQAGLNNTTARLNSFFGYQAGMSTTTGCCNSFFGNAAGVGNLTGRSNVFAGGSAGARNLSGSFNTFIGDVAAWNFVTDVGNTTGSLNTFVGYATGWGNTTGSNLTLLGAQSNLGAEDLNFATALGAGAVVSTSNTVVLGRSADTVQVPGTLNVAGTFAANILDGGTQFNLGGARVLDADPGGNLFVGQSAGLANTTGAVNTFIGQFAGQNNTVGLFNTFVGNRTGGSNTIGCCNNFFGNDAGFSTTEGGLNSFFGGSAGLFNTTGSQNTFFGDRTGQNNTTGGSNAFFGVFAGLGNIDGNNNTLLGTQANVGAGNLSFATAIGAGAVVNASNTVVLGRSADTVQVPGALNVAGTFAASSLDVMMQFNLAGARVLDADLLGGNLFVGQSAGQANTTGAINTFIGQSAGQQNTAGTFNTFVGNRTGGSNTIGCCNNFFGNDAGFSTTEGGLNSFFGGSAGLSNTTGSQNTFFGDRTGQNNTTGGSNAFFGVFAGLGNTVGNNNTLLGTQANVGAGDLSFATAIGAGAVVSTNNTVVLGRHIDSVQVPGNVGIGTIAPEARLDVRNGNILVGSPGQGIILRSPDGASCRLLAIDNAGALSLTSVACP